MSRKHRDRCPDCRSLKVRYLGSDVLNGNPYTPASDTFIHHRFRCEKCGAEWGEFV